VDIRVLIGNLEKRPIIVVSGLREIPERIGKSFVGDTRKFLLSAGHLTIYLSGASTSIVSLTATIVMTRAAIDQKTVSFYFDVFYKTSFTLTPWLLEDS